MREYQDFWEVTSTSLDFALRAAGIEPTRSVRDPLMEQYLYLEPYPEVPAALAALDGHRLAILSNGSPTMLEVLVRNSGLGRWIETVISVDRVRTYKPSPACYALVEEVLGIAKPEILFVSSNGFDVVGAKTFGFQVAWIHRAGGDAQAAAPLGASAMFRVLRGRAEELGHAPDHTVSALTELPQLL